MKPIFQKREQPHGGWMNLLLILFSVLLAFLITTILIAIVGKPPILVFRELFIGAFGRTSGLVETVVKGTPLLFAGLGMVIAFKAKVWNVGGEGQIYMGALGAVWVGINVHGLPAWAHIALCMLAGGIFGSLWALIPALLKVYLKVNEVITCLMLNYISILFISWLVHGPMEEVGGFMPQTPRIAGYGNPAAPFSTSAPSCWCDYRHRHGFCCFYTALSYDGWLQYPGGWCQSKRS